MSWDSKQDYCGLAGSGLQVKTANENRSGSYLEKLGKIGGIVATKAFGQKNSSPTNDYVLSAVIQKNIVLGTVNTVGGKRYALQSVKITTGAAAEPTVSATAVEIEEQSDGCDNTFEPVAVGVGPCEIAQDVAGSCEVTGTDCEITNVETEISCTVQLHTKNNDPVASDIHTGHVVVNLTIGQYGEATPTVTPNQGWDISSPLSCEDPDADMPVWKVTLTKKLTKVMGTANGGDTANGGGTANGGDAANGGGTANGGDAANGGGTANGGRAD